MSYGLVVGYFDDREHADQAIEALRNRKLEAKAIAAEQEKSSEFRNPVKSQELSMPIRIVVAATLIGAIFGGLAGFISMWLQAGFANFLAMGPLLAAISGAAAGGIVGLMLGASVHFDTTSSDASTSSAQTDTGQKLISLEVENKEDLSVAEAIMQERGASEVHTKLAHAPAETPIKKTKELAK